MQPERFRLPDRQIACRVALLSVRIVTNREDFPDNDRQTS
jgi:hypothetical protein